MSTLYANMPDSLGKYQIQHVLGKGAMGVVYAALDPHIRRTVAIKTVRRELIEADQGQHLAARFRNEAQAAGQLSHPGIVSVYEYGESGDLAYIVMEYIEGNGLDVYFRQGIHFSAVDLVSIMAQLLEALDYAHEQGIVHRDIKPANLIVMSNGRIKVTDFGIAHIDNSELTQIGSVMGTPSYIAPEQYSGNAPIDRRADVFSAGVIFYQLLCGSKPFNGSSEAVIYQVCHQQPALPSSVAPERNLAQFDQVVLKALEKKPEQRFQSAKAFQEAILQAYRQPVQAALSEETIIHVPKSATAQSGSGSTGVHGADTQPSGGSSLPGNWDPTVLKQVEDKLMRLVGPMARIMVKKAARTTHSLDELYRALSQEISAVQDRTEFMQSRSIFGGMGTASGVEASSTAGSKLFAGLHPSISADEIEQATKLLAPFLGPIAKVLAKKTAAKAADRHHYYQLLAENLTDIKDRGKFLKDAGLSL